MPLGKTGFAQLMDFIPAHEFRRCVNRYRNSASTSSFIRMLGGTLFMALISSRPRC